MVPFNFALDALKRDMVDTPVLRLLNFELAFFVKTDASNVGIGAILSQDKHSIAFFNRKFGPQLHATSMYIKELHASTTTIQKWRQYLLGRFFIIKLITRV